MDAIKIGELVFGSLPSGLKGAVVFSRTSISAYDPITGNTTSAVTTASSEATISGAKGTGTESFSDLLAIRQKYLRMTVRAVPLAGFRPQAGDTVFAGGETFRVVGCEAVSPNGTDVAVFNVTVER